MTWQLEEDDKPSPIMLAGIEITNIIVANPDVERLMRSELTNVLKALYGLEDHNIINSIMMVLFGLENID